MSTVASISDTSIAKFHFGLNVSDLTRSVEFYSLLFNSEPAKFFGDYAKFELREPPLVLSLLPNSQSRGGSLYHLGLRLTSSESLVETQRRLELNGVSTRREEGVECCYARQTKFWITDPDLNLWELYVMEEDLGHHGTDAPPTVAPVPKPDPVNQQIWEHRLREPLPAQIPRADASLDEVRFEGTFGTKHTDEAIARILQEARRCLKPGGKVHVHNLVANREFSDGMPQLPGPAAVIQYVPLESELAKHLEAAGFVEIHFEKLGDQPCFVMNGVEMREMRLSAWNPQPQGETGKGYVMYKGPFRQVSDDAGNVYPCGELVAVDSETWSRMQIDPFSPHFVCFKSPSP